MTGRQCPDDGTVTVKAPKSLVISAIVTALGAIATGGFGFYQAQRAEKPYAVTMSLPAHVQKQIDESSDSIKSLEKSANNQDLNLALLSRDMNSLTASLKDFVDETRKNREATWDAIGELRKRTP